MNEVAATEHPDALVVQVCAVAVDVARVRHAVRTYLRERGVAARAVDDMVLIVSELTTNAVHASASPTDPVRVRVAPEDGSTLIEVEDRGGLAFGGASTELPDVSATRGRGLPIVHHLAAAIEIEQSDGATRVRARYR